tara:strand:- start:283 stop:447 length:165 start_codon:yes stop_codon:yes gene_type:complete
MESSGESTKKLVQTYMDQMSEIEKIAMEIAKKNLKTSFDIEKSLGFIEWVKNNS